MPTGVYKRTPFHLKALKVKHKENKDNTRGYRGLHNWVEYELGKPHFCEHCGKRNLKHRQYHWANVSGKYKRDLNDWIRLCAKCHKKFDKNNKK